MGKQFTVHFKGEDRFTGNLSECRKFMSDWGLKWVYTDGNILYTKEVKE